MSMPQSWGVNLTSKLHTHAEGPTDPSTIRLPANFTVVVTGAGKGVGRGIAVAYARAGANLVIASRTKADLDSLEAEIKGIDPNLRVWACQCDVMSDGDVKTLADGVEREFGRVDVAVANAGIISKYIEKDREEKLPSGIDDDEDFGRVIETNLMGSYRVAKYFVPLLAKCKDGAQSLVVVTSLAAHAVDSHLTPAAYRISKLANVRMVESVHEDHGSDGVMSFAVHPGGVVTVQTERHHVTQRGQWWNDALQDDVGLCGGFLTWLTRERREWLSGRYLAATWDVEELEAMKQEIVKEDKLKFRMVV